jgi:hypothetical protein
LVANDWVESQATWNVRKTGTAWAGSAGCSSAGTDYSATPLWSGNMTPTANAEQQCALDLTEFAAMVAANQGLVMFDASDNRNSSPNLRTSDYVTETYRPKLVIDYNAGGARSFCVIAG